MIALEVAREIFAGIRRDKFCQNSDFVTGTYDTIGSGTRNFCGNSEGEILPKFRHCNRRI